MEEITKSVEDLTTEVKSVAAQIEKVATLPEDVEAAKADLETQAATIKTTSDQLGVMVNDLAEFKANLKHDLGKSGADDWRQEFSKFVKAVYHEQKRLRTPEWLEKAVADYVTDVDAQGGYLVPTLVADQVTKLTLRHGQIWPLVNKVTVPAGQQIKFPWESTLASVAYRATGHGGAGTEIDPAVVWGADTLRPTWINGYAKIANEAMTTPGVSIPDNIAQQLMGQIVRGIEHGIILGDDSSSAQPHDGILVATSVNSQTDMATVTMALVATFIAECIADHEGSGDTAENYLVTTDAAAYQLKSGASATGTNAWGDPTQDRPPVFNGYRMITSPHSISTTHRMIMSPLGKITVGWSGQFSVSFNESLGWASNETWLMVSTHADHALGNPDMHHKAVFTALV